MTSAALLLVVLSSLLHASWNASTKSSRSPVAFLFWMILLSCVVLAPGLLWTKLDEISRAVWLWILLSGVVHALYALFLSRAYERGDLSLVYPIARSTPAFVPFVAVPLLGETITPGGGLGIVLVVVSIWAIQAAGLVGHRRNALRALLRPENAFAYWTLAATVAYSLTDAQVMRLLDRGPWSGAMPRSFFLFLTQALVQLVFFSLLARRRLTGRVVACFRDSWRSLLFATVVSIVSYALILEAMRSAAVSYVVAVRQTSVVFALAIALLVLGERPSRLRILGALGTMAGVTLIALAGG